MLAATAPQPHRNRPASLPFPGSLARAQNCARHSLPATARHL